MFTKSFLFAFWHLFRKNKKMLRYFFFLVFIQNKILKWHLWGWRRFLYIWSDVYLIGVWELQGVPLHRTHTHLQVKSFSVRKKQNNVGWVSYSPSLFILTLWTSSTNKSTWHWGVKKELHFDGGVFIFSFTPTEKRKKEQAFVHISKKEEILGYLNNNFLYMYVILGRKFTIGVFRK